MFEDILSGIREGNGLTKIFLDYDGTLVNLTSQPELAIPSNKLIDLLGDLKRKIPLYLVTGRDLNGIISLVGKGFNIIAMHGSEFMSKEGLKWSIDGFEEYQKRTNELYRKYAYLETKFKGLRIIDKRGGLQFHYYNVDSRYATELGRIISEINEEGFELYSGKFVYELRVKGVDKGKAMLKYIDRNDFIMFAGDDRTDEDAFGNLSDQITIKVGEGITVAKYRVNSPYEMKRLLAALLANRERVFRK
jgi:trehalose 6-phosphate phosphatase